MQQLKSIAALSQYRQSLSQSVALVPTMGALHAGHLSLVELAKQHGEQVVVSIFVNPTQFNQASDLEQYPSNLAEDLAQLEAVGVDAVFLPDFDIMYPDEYAYKITENQLSQRFCGAHRPGHFDGVLTVVMKLFNAIKPDVAVFGEKDYQQLTLIQNMVNAFFMGIKLISAPIIREADGLAMSSRNVRLTPVQRKIAPELYKALTNDDALSKKQMHLTTIGFDVDYLEVLGDRLLVAATLGDVRLIDNVPYTGKGASA